MKLTNSKLIITKGIFNLVLFFTTLLATSNSFSIILAQNVTTSSESVEPSLIKRLNIPEYQAWLPVIAVGLAFHAVIAVSLQRFAVKENLKYSWIAWVPVLQFSLLVQAVDRPSWQNILLFIPIINFMFLAILVYELQIKYKKN
jgi:hypothetical protein